MSCKIYTIYQQQRLACQWVGTLTMHENVPLARFHALGVTVNTLFMIINLIYIAILFNNSYNSLFIQPFVELFV